MYSDKIAQLRELIENTLLPLINGLDVVLLDVPFYTNIGDTLIWEGTRQFLKRNGIKCLLEHPQEDYDFRAISADTVILLSGGGNFGDIWPQFNVFRKKVIETYSHNKIIILPQTVFYNDESKMLADAELYARHPDLTIIARDKKSYDRLKTAFENEILLLPDMAFCIDSTKLQTKMDVSSDTPLFLRRIDCELNDNYNYGKIVPSECDVHDWPSIKYFHPFWPSKWIDKIERHTKRCPDCIRNWYGVNMYRPHQIKLGVEFLSKYSKIYTTRLHAAILSMLLGKEFVFFDNNYGKNREYYESWLKDCSEITFVETNG